MAVLNSADTLRNLKKKGFKESNKDHKYLELHHANKLILHTKISHGASHDIRDPLIRKMAEQCALSKSEFIEFARCSMEREDYLKILREKNYLQ